MKCYFKNRLFIELNELSKYKKSCINCIIRSLAMDVQYRNRTLCLVEETVIP